VEHQGSALNRESQRLVDCPHVFVDVPTQFGWGTGLVVESYCPLIADSEVQDNAGGTHPQRTQEATRGAVTLDYIEYRAIGQRVGLLLEVAPALRHKEQDKSSIRAATRASLVAEPNGRRGRAEPGPWVRCCRLAWTGQPGSNAGGISSYMHGQP
jgi:hypothetical protein